MSRHDRMYGTNIFEDRDGENLQTDSEFDSNRKVDIALGKSSSYSNIVSNGTFEVYNHGLPEINEECTMMQQHVEQLESRDIVASRRLPTTYFRSGK